MATRSLYTPSSITSTYRNFNSGNVYNLTVELRNEEAPNIYMHIRRCYACTILYILQCDHEYIEKYVRRYRTLNKGSRASAGKEGYAVLSI